MQKVQAGPFTNLLQKIWDTLLKGMDDLVSEGDWDTKSEDIKDKNTIGVLTSYIRKTWPNGDKVTNVNEKVCNVSYILPISGELTDDMAKAMMKEQGLWKNADNITVHISYTGKSDVSKSDLTLKKATEIFEKFREDNSVDSEATSIYIQQIIQGSEVTASKNMKISLTKVTGGKEIEVQLNKITANYDLLEAIEDVNTIVQDDNFLDELPENESACYDIVSEEDDLDVNPCDDFSAVPTIQSMIYQSLRLQNKLRVISLEAHGDECDLIFSTCDDIIYIIDDITLTLSNILIADKECTSAIGEGGMIDIAEGSSIQDFAIDVIEKDVKTYLDCLEVVYLNCSHGEQVKLDESIKQIEATLRDAKRRI